MGNCTVQNPPVWTDEIPKWDKQEYADGDAMGAVIEKLFNNDVYLKSMIDRQAAQPIPVTLPASGWTGSAVPYTQTVTAEGIKATDNPLLVSMLADGATEAVQKAYNKAFGIVAAGTGTTGDGTVTFKVYKKPATDLIVGLKGV